MLAAGIILAIMIVPIIASITREVLVAVPQSQREARAGAGRDALGDGAHGGAAQCARRASWAGSSSAWAGRWARPWR